MNLLELVKGFYESQGYQVTIKDPTFLVAENRIYAEEIDQVCVWILNKEIRKDKPSIIIEEDYLNRFRGFIKKYPGAKLRLLVDSLEGLSAEFRSKAYGEFKVRIQLPIQFFDTPFSWEVAKSTASAIKELTEAAKINEQKRVSQPYSKRAEVDKEGLDIVTDLMQEIDSYIDNSKPFIWFIIAPAGQGKSFSFASIFAKIYDKFQDSKRRTEIFPRPLPLLSSHLKEAAGPSVKGLIDAFIRTEFAANLRRECFNWLVDNRFGLLMLDGLDEVIAKDSNFIEYLEDRITSPYSKAAIVISMRDSLFETCNELKEFIQDYGNFIETFVLKRWGQKEIKAHAYKNLEGSGQKRDGHERANSNDYLNIINKSPVLQRLSSTPFYADMLVNLFKEDEGYFSKAGELSEKDLINITVEAMSNREYQKGMLNKDIFPPCAYREWLEEIAIENYKAKGIYMNELRELAELSSCLVDANLNENQTNGLITGLLMAPFFKKSEVSGKIELTHELIAEYLVGEKLVKYFQSDAPKFCYLASLRAWPPDSIILSVLVDGLAGNVHRLSDLICRDALPQDGIRNIIQILIRSEEGYAEIRQKCASLEGVDLEGMIFKKADLQGVSFRASDLTNTVFDNCNLQNTRFEGSVIRGTVFSNTTKDFLRNAKFGDFEHFYSATINNESIDDYEQFMNIINQYTGEKIKTEGLCPSARQLLFLFGKFVRPNGEPRRDVLDRKGVLRGRKEKGADSSERFLEAAIEFEFLCQEEKGKQIKRARGEKYGEIVTFVKNQVPSRNIVTLLDSLCRIPNCPHVPPK
jgi:hypothetical protein